METDTLQLWVREIHKGFQEMGFKVERTLFSGKSPFQQIDIVQTAAHGRMLLNDGIIMLSERDEFIYHEMIAHVPLFVHPKPEKILIIGGGDGGTVREVLKHSSVKSVVMVEIDKMVVDACKAHLPSLSCELTNPKLDLIIDDGVAYVNNTTDKYDVVIVDSTDPVGPGAVLFGEPFYKKVAQRLHPDGILVTQSESPFYDQKEQLMMYTNQRQLFSNLYMYLFPTLTYPGGLWSFGFASNTINPVIGLDPDRVHNSGISFKYYSPDVHKAAFMLPEFIRQTMKEVLNPV